MNPKSWGSYHNELLLYKGALIRKIDRVIDKNYLNKNTIKKAAEEVKIETDLIF